MKLLITFEQRKANRMKTRKKRQTAYLYSRWSTPEQSDGDSERRQLERARRWCKDNRIELDTSYRDEGISARLGKHRRYGKLGRFLDAVKSGEVARGSVLIVESLDRLSRERPRNARQLFDLLLSSGVEILTLSPERHYTEASLDETMSHIEMVFIADRAAAESALKEDRVGQAWANKRANAQTQKLTSRCPGWLKLSKDRKRFELIPERAAVVRQIFKLCIAGDGLKVIARKLNEKGIPNFGRGKHWSYCYIGNILRWRAVLGEYQPHEMHKVTVKDQDGEWIEQRRKQSGDAVQGYFPSAITEETFERAQTAMHGRANQRGRRGKNIRNLFTGIMYSAIDGSQMNIHTTRTGAYLQSQAKRNGRPGAAPHLFPYQAIEDAMISMATGLAPSDVLPSSEATDEVTEQLREAESHLATLDRKITTISRRFEHDTNSDDDQLLSMRDRLRSKRGDVAARCEHLRRELQQGSSSSLDETQTLLEAISQAEGDELIEMRTRLKALLRTMISEIWLHVFQTGKLKIAALEVCFRAGEKRNLVVLSTAKVNVTLALQIDGCLRDSGFRKELGKVISKFFEEVIREGKTIDSDAYIVDQWGHNYKAGPWLAPFIEL